MSGILTAVAGIGGGTILTAGYNAGSGGTYGYSDGSLTGVVIGAMRPLPRLLNTGVPDLFWSFTPSSTLYLRLAASMPNGGWSTLRIGGNTWNRASAVYSMDSPIAGVTTWAWTGQGNPFADGQSYPITLT